jgi:hypothetical protein
LGLAGGWLGVGGLGVGGLGVGGCEAMARTGRYKEEAPRKAGVGANRPRAQRQIIRMRVIMTAVNCSPALASRRDKYDDDFRVPALLGAISQIIGEAA